MWVQSEGAKPSAFGFMQSFPAQRHRQQGADIAHEWLRRIPSAMSPSPENPPAGRSKSWEHFNEVHIRLSALGKEAEILIGEMPIDTGVHFATVRRRIREALEAEEIGQEINELTFELLG